MPFASWMDWFAEKEWWGGKRQDLTPFFVAGQHPEIPWALMYAMRNRVAHGYFQVDYEMVWKSIHVDLPPLRDSVQGLLDSSA